MTKGFGLRGALVLLVLIAIAPVFAVVVQASLSERRTHLAQAESNLRSLVELGAAHQEQLVEGARQTLIAVAHAPPVAAGDSRACAGYLRKLQAQFPAGYGTFGLLDPQGRLTCRAEPLTAPVVSRDRLFFRNALETGRFSVGEFTISRASGRPVLTFGLPVQDEAGGPLGVAYLALDVAQSDSNLRRLAIPPGMRLLVIDRNAVVLASAGAGGVTAGSAVAEHFLRDAISRGEPRYGRAQGGDGADYLFALRPLARSGEGRLFVAGMMSREGVLQPAAQRLRYQLGALLLITLAGAAAAAWVADRVLLRPMGRLLDRMEDLRNDRPAPGGAAAPALHELNALDRGLQEVSRSLAQRAVLRDGALAEMEHQKLLLESVLQGMAEGLLVMDRRGHFLHVNAAALRILPGLAELNRDPQPLQADSRRWGFFELDGSTPLAPGARPVEQVLAGREVENFRYRVRGPISGGADKVIEASARTVRGPQGEAAGAVLVFWDITDAWRAEQALQASEQRYRTLFESNPHPMWVFDVRTLRFLTVNDAAVAHYGYSREEFLAMTLDDIRPPEDVPQLRRSMSARARPLTPPAPWRHRTRDGRVIFVEITSHALDYDGHDARMVLAHDITERLAAQRELSLLNETLERRVAERTRELAVANEELESFSYSVSHDLRAPLQVIDGFGRALVARHAERLDGQARHYLDRIRDNTRQMSQLIDDLLALARVTRTEIVAEPVDMAARARQIVERLRQRFPEREVEVEIDDGITAHGDARLLAVALENLIDNAWKYTARVSPARIHVGQRTGPEGEAVYFVADNGAGFEMAYADKLFKAFQRLHAASEFAGTGIGLATVHRVVARHGGRVWAEARPGCGATFQFTLNTLKKGLPS